jgi:hypothetical protein
MSVERLCQAREQLRRQFMEYVENLATGDSADDDIDQVVSLREAIDALDHAIKGGWHEPSSEPRRHPAHDQSLLDFANLRALERRRFAEGVGEEPIASMHSLLDRKALVLEPI